MKKLTVNIHGKPSAKLDDARIKGVLSDVLGNLIMSRYEVLIQQARIAKLTKFAIAASNQLGIEFDGTMDVGADVPMLTEAQIVPELEQFAKTLSQILDGKTFSVTFTEMDRGIPVISEMPDLSDRNVSTRMRQRLRKFYEGNGFTAVADVSRRGVLAAA